MRIDHDNLEEFQYPQGYDLKEESADARSFHLQKRFPVIYMLGNVFQAFLTRGDQEEMLARVGEHLHPSGCFLFGTRNPSLKNLFEVGKSERYTYTTPDGRQLVVTEQQEYNPLTQIQHYTMYRKWQPFSEEQIEKTTRIALRYVFPQEMEALLFYNGFQNSLVLQNCLSDLAETSFSIVTC